MQRLCPNCEEQLRIDDLNVGYCNNCHWFVTLEDSLAEPRLPEPPPKLPYVSIDIETTGLNPSTCQTLEVGAVIDDWKTPIDRLPRFRRVLVYEHVTGSPYAMALNAGLLKLIGNVPKDPPQPIHDAVATWAEKCAIKQDVSLVATMLFGAHPHICWWNIPNTLLSMMPSSQDLLELAANPPGISCYCQPNRFAYLFHVWLKINGIDPKSVQAAGKNFASFDMQFLYRLPGFTSVIKFRHRVLDPAILYWQPEDERLPDSKTCYERAGIDTKVAHTAVEDALAVVRLIRIGVKRLKGMS
jgi:hypothetical protein